jgi:NitT/TauT family transport system substrate-binding protein
MKQRKNVTQIIASIAILTFLFFTGCGGNGKKESDKDTQIVIGYPTLRIALPVFVAQEKGFFEKHGLNVRLQKYETAQPLMDALVSGSIEIGGFTALPITLSAMARSKTNLIFVAGMFEDEKHPISILIVKKDNSPIKSIKDLRGKRIGILPTRAYEVWLQKILVANGIDPSEVIIQQISPPLQADALNSGTVDALFTNDPAATITVSRGIGIPLTEEPLVPSVTGYNPFYFGSFNVTEKFANENPEKVKKIAKALDEAIRYISANPDSARILMTGYLPEPQQKFVSDFPNSFFRTTNEVSNTDLKNMADYYLKEKVLPTEIKVDGLQYKY